MGPYSCPDPSCPLTIVQFYGSTIRHFLSSTPMVYTMGYNGQLLQTMQCSSGQVFLSLSLSFCPPAPSVCLSLFSFFFDGLKKIYGLIRLLLSVITEHMSHPTCILPDPGTIREHRRLAPLSEILDDRGFFFRCHFLLNCSLNAAIARLQSC